MNCAVWLMIVSLLNCALSCIFCHFGTLFRLCYFYVIYVFCLLVVLVRLSVPVQVIDWKDPSPK